jgi:simple sugar transport system ATP-binding protein
MVRHLDLADTLELGRGGRWRALRRSRHRAAEPALAHWDVRSAGPAARGATLSGGNAQKLVLARELARPPVMVLACYPTRGLDPEAARTVAQRVLEAADAGAAVIWIGAELDELLAVSDRIVVLSQGRASEPMARPFDRGAIGLAMAGAS